jgi:hydroxymethylbilane synthase
VDLRGNLDTRLRKLDDEEYDAIVLACAGLTRMGLESRITQVLPYEVCLPAAGQGALAIQCRAGDPACELATRLDSYWTRACVLAERALLERLEGGCQVPVAALAREDGGRIKLEAAVASLDGISIVRKCAVGNAESPRDLGLALAAELLDSPAKGLLDAARAASGPKEIGAA